MIRIICPECKNAYLQKAESEFTCPGCNAKIPESEENFLSGAQYYHEGDFAAASDCLMKYIVKNGAEPRAIFYKALCDGQNFDEDTLTLKDLYVKILESMLEISDDDFVHFLTLANDEVLKIEKALTQLHLELFADADAEKIKKEVSAIIRLQDEAKIYRNKLNDFANTYNERATNKISVKLSGCFFVDPVAAAEVGAVKFEKIVESINSHTVFTGILSNDIKNLEIYYRCVVMFFEKNRRKYEFLISSSERFSMIAKLLEDGKYSTIKGVPTICEKLKAAAYDFFQESLRDHDDEFEQQTETVVVLESQTVEVPAENPEEPVEATENEPENKAFEDVYSSTIEENSETTDESNTIVDVYSSADKEIAEEAVEEIVDKDTETPETSEDSQSNTETLEETVEQAEAPEENEPEDNAVVEINEAIEEPAQVEESAESEESTEADEVSEAEEITETAEITETEEAVEITEVAEIVEVEESTETEEATQTSDTTESEGNESQVITLKTIAESGNLIEEDKLETTESEKETNIKKAPKHKKSVAPIIAVLAILVAIIGLVAIKVVPTKLKESNYEKAAVLFDQTNYAEAAALYEKLGDYEDSQDKYLVARYNQAIALESEKKYDEAKEIYVSLGNYEDSAGKVNSCTYNSALMALEQGKIDEAMAVFKALDGYADSLSMINECNYQKAVKLIEEKNYEKAIEMLSALKDHPESANKILEAKYAYVKDNLNAENETTLSYLKDLTQAKYKDSADIRNKLLGTSTIIGEGVSTCINYSETDLTENLQEVDSSKPFYFHVTVTNEALYTKRLTLAYRTSAGYGFPEKYFVLTENENTYTLTYPSDPGADYSITFSVLDDDGATLISQKVALN